MGLATFLNLKVASPIGLALSKRLETGLKGQVMGSGQSQRTGHLIINEVASPMGLATVSLEI